MWKQAINELNSLIEELNLKSKNEIDANNAKLVDNIDLDSSPIFSPEDLILYRGILKFYLKQYSAALKVNLPKAFRTMIPPTP